MCDHWSISCYFGTAVRAILPRIRCAGVKTDTDVVVTTNDNRLGIKMQKCYKIDLCLRIG